MRVRGEISGFRGQHSSGHAYFTLKDENAAIDAVIWKSTLPRLRFKPEEGLEVVATGRLTTFPQVEISDRHRRARAGRRRRADGAARGAEARSSPPRACSTPTRKRPLPYLPRIVGVVTSPTGAVIRDILHRLDDRFPSHVLVWPVRVQGETCAAEVAAAIHGFNGLIAGASVPRPDLLIVARGGGSIEDLWGFNEEIVVRAVAASAIPLISAVGHETDTTLIDLVADLRAPTPTAAAERAVPVRADLHIQVTSFGLRVMSCLRRLVEGQRTMLLALARGLPRRSEILALPRQRFDGVSARLGRALHANAHAHRVALARSATRLRPHLVARAAQGKRERLVASTAQAGARCPLWWRGRASVSMPARGSSIRSAITTCLPAASPSPAMPKGKCCAAPPTFIAASIWTSSSPMAMSLRRPMAATGRLHRVRSVRAAATKSRAHCCKRAGLGPKPTLW